MEAISPDTRRPAGQWLAGRRSDDLIQVLLEVEPVVVHDLYPRGDEVLHEPPVGVVLCVDLGQ